MSSSSVYYPKDYPDEAHQLFLQAVDYHERGDAYLAVKLYKKAIRIAPDWPDPYHYLGQLFKDRAQWKSTFHYCHCAIELNPEDQVAWRNLAIAATALQKWKAARRAWNRLGFKFRDSDRALDLDLGPIPVRLDGRQYTEVLWAVRIDPARAQLISIPHPANDFGYLDRVLIDSEPRGYRIMGKKRMPVYPILDLLKRSFQRVFTVRLFTESIEQVDQLARLCQAAGLGFDNWARTQRIWVPPSHRKAPEYIEPQDRGIHNPTIAIASFEEKSVCEVLESWRVITLAEHGEIEVI